MKYALILLLIFSACQSKNDASKPSITGKWEYKTVELYSGEKFDISDSAYNKLHQQHIGLTLSFSGGKTFTVTQKTKDDPDKFVARQDYELPGDTILRLINTGRPDDEFPIISLSDSLLKVNLFNSPYGYVVFQRIK